MERRGHYHRRRGCATQSSQSAPIPETQQPAPHETPSTARGRFGERDELFSFLVNLARVEAGIISIPASVANNAAGDAGAGAADMLLLK